MYVYVVYIKKILCYHVCSNISFNIDARLATVPALPILAFDAFSYKTHTHCVIYPYPLYVTIELLILIKEEGVGLEAEEGLDLIRAADRSRPLSGNSSDVSHCAASVQRYLASQAAEFQ